MFRRVAGILALAALLTSATAYADGRAELEKVRAAYLAKSWGEAEDRLRSLLDPASGIKERPLVSQARMYLGAVLLGKGQRDEAVDLFEKLILDDLGYDPDPLSFPTDVINTFIDVRAHLQERIRIASQNAARQEAERRQREEAEKAKQKRWLEALKDQAAEDKSVVRNNRLVAFVPFGAGQFQNRDQVLGWTFLGVEAALVAGTGITTLMYRYSRAHEASERASNDLEQKAAVYASRADDVRLVNLSFALGFVAVAVAGIVHANAVYVPEYVDKKRRPLPPLATIAPTIAPVPSGVMFGLSGLSF